ncbi:cobalamin B12-binding domain-containing protein [Nocardiopsis ansamitocini]|uniref:cobalamin B12-binding domain-containing protein n=1 Tax=Nocardiopsis ansamitocini TaxID=1670832 RepID=UPI0025553D9C|nr:cobalamin-dependent protein [Nocardiopsis ansamitocini]
MRYLERLGEADEAGALALLRDSLAQGWPIESILLDVIASAQLSVGWLWQTNEWSVAREHAATHVSERVLDTLVAEVLHQRVPPPSLGRIVVACVDGEWHALPARLVADVLRLRGWEVAFLGTSVPEGRLITYLQEHNPQVVALSCSLSTRLPKAHRMIQACRRMGLPVLVGGRGFGPDDTWARLLDADAWAGSAREAAQVLERGVHPRTNVHTSPTVLPSHSEYASLLRRRGELIAQTVQRLTEDHPELGLHRVEARDRTVEDLGHLVDFLAVSLYVANTELFVRFLHWMHDVLEPRGIPFTTVLETLGHYETLLYDYPLTVETLRAARLRMTGVTRPRRTGRAPAPAALDNH